MLLNKGMNSANVPTVHDRSSLLTPQRKKWRDVCLADVVTSRGMMGISVFVSHLLLFFNLYNTKDCIVPVSIKPNFSLSFFDAGLSSLLQM